MRIFVLNTNYLSSLGQLYRRNPGLEDASYAEQSAVLDANFISESGSYARAFTTLGHAAMAVSANNAPLQTAWAREHGDPSLAGAAEDRRRSISPRALAHWVVDGRHIPAYIRHGAEASAVLTQIVLAQVETFRPDVVLNQDMFLVGRTTLAQMKSLGARVTGQHAASPLPSTVPVDDYDLLVSSFLPTVDAFRARGVPAYLNRLAFDPEVLNRLEPNSKEIRWRATFVGSLQSIHSSRVAFLEDLAPHLPELRIWTPDASALGRRSPLRSRLMGSVSGLQMYQVLRSSFATLNHHGDIDPYANNMRLFEATGVGSLLVTDAKSNLSDLFAPGVEVLTYRSAQECADLINSMESEVRSRIARAGQQRTLGEHTYLVRARELVDFFRQLLN